VNSHLEPRKFPRDKWEALWIPKDDPNTVANISRKLTNEVERQPKQLKLIHPERASSREPESWLAAIGADPPQWIARLNELAMADDKADAINYLFEQFDNFIQQDRLGEIDFLLGSADFTHLPDEILVALVRIPFLARRFLKNWQGAVFKVAYCLHRKGHDHRSLLGGLL
jgi:hypothetical protein